MRIYEAAKQYEVKTDELMKVLAEAGFSVKSHMSSLTREMAAVADRAFKTDSVKSKAKVGPKTAKKTKAKAKDAPAKKATKVAPKVAKKEGTVKKATKKGAEPAKAALHPEGRPKPRQKTVQRATKPERRDSAKPTRTKPTGGGRPPRTSPPTTDRGRKPRPYRKRDAATTAAQQKAVRESVRRTLAKIETTRRTKRRKSKVREDKPAVDQPVKISDGMTVREFADVLKLTPPEIITKCMEMGVPATINQVLERDTMELIVDDMEKSVQYVADEVEDLVETEAQVDPSRLISRAPIVTVMGHVDHGKTSILDYIRKTKVASGEAGGITQHIGAYEVITPQGKIAFVDTPGHKAFTSMRARGAKVTDIVVLVVAADDGVMPQTVEAIDHAKAADVPILVAINKIDLPSAKPSQVLQQLAERDVVAEGFGGDVVAVEVSAKTGEGIDRLLEMILLQAELIELKADPVASAQAVAIEIKKEEGRGILCSVLVTQGTLRIGDVFVVGAHYGKVRALFDHRGRPVRKAGPSTPVMLLGANGVPEAGDQLTVVREEREARDLSIRRQQSTKDRERQATTKKMTLEELYMQIQQGDVKELRLVLKGDTNGSVEALGDNLVTLSNDEVVVKVIRAGVGVVGESDVLLATSSEAVIIGFNVKVSPQAQELAEREKVEIKTYDIIYECISEVDDAIKGLLEPELIEKVVGRAEVRKVFKISRLGQIAGSLVVEGTITRNSTARVLREEQIVFEGRIGSLKRFQDDVREVQKDFECGIGINGFGDLREGDVIETYVIEEHARVV